MSERDSGADSPADAPIADGTGRGARILRDEANHASAARPPQRAAEDAAIEGLRGFAALLVMWAHYAGLFFRDASGFKVATTGVDLFFVLSGFVFAPYLLGRPLPLLPHLLRRFFRLYPLYLAALLAYALAKEPAAEAWRHFGAHLLMAHTLQSLEVAFHYNPAFWSLPPEVEFYLLLPLLAAVGGVRSLPLALLAAVGMREWLVLTAAGSAQDPDWRAIASVHLPGLLCEFLLGAVAYRLARQAPAKLLKVLGLVVAPALLALVAAIFQSGGDAASAPPWLRGNIALLAALGYAALLAPLSRWGTAMPAGLRARLLAAGHLSYGVYLFHNLMPPLLRRAFPELGEAAVGVVAIAATLALAKLAHHALERPLRAYGRRLAAALIASRNS
jgi:peptidoglycan/LPS O-acetylase OafA/YrhL